MKKLKSRAVYGSLSKYKEKKSLKKRLNKISLS